ncbi:hypothetical protein AB0D12_17400 [Streptomyces sp. NPDC048479]|uniref:hypothetical protein n=1 Tax=Streptomyces sp. NPDC048479 TaxID=3154725 RepID=UPI0034243D3A
MEQVATLVFLEGPETIAEASADLVRSAWRWIQMLRLGDPDPGSEDTRNGLIVGRVQHRDAIEAFAEKCRAVLDD